jgi:hypothetical protein
MNIESTTGSNTDVELRRIQADFEIRQAELKEKQTQRQYEFEERQAQRQAEERQHAVDTELKRLEIDNAAGRGVRFTGAQATVAAAAIALLSGLIGGAIQAWQSGNVEQIKSAGLIASEQKKADGLLAIEQKKQTPT